MEGIIIYKNFLLYGHGGAYNHGAEAIIISTVNLIRRIYPKSRIILSTHFKEQDLEFGMPVDEYCERNLEFVKLEQSSKQKGLYNNTIYKETLDRVEADSICLSVGGDTYCYGNWHRWATIHKRALKVGAKSILWSCSIEPSMITDEMLDVLRTHDLITARESITYNALRGKGLNNVVLCSDIAFLLNPKETLLPKNFIVDNTVAINISPLVVRRESVQGITLKNIKTVIEYIINNSNMNIALIPHVLMPMDNDFLLLKKIYNEIGQQERVSLISDKLSATEYKYIISKCRFSICARTHAGIASYSSCVPTIAIGYSVKAKGIALDLGFNDYVLSIKDLINEDNLVSMFKHMVSNESFLRQMLKKNMRVYKQKANVKI